MTINLEAVNMQACFESSELRDWARSTLPRLPPLPFHSDDRGRMRQELSLKVKALEDHISEDRDNELKIEIAQCLALLSPTRLLPAELVAFIMRLFMHGYYYMVLPGQERHVVVSGICRTWRDIALGDPLIWNQVSLYSGYYAKVRTASVEREVNRLYAMTTRHMMYTRDTTFDLYVDLPNRFAATELVKPILPHISRCKSLHERAGGFFTRFWKEATQANPVCPASLFGNLVHLGISEEWRPGDESEYDGVFVLNRSRVTFPRLRFLRIGDMAVGAFICPVLRSLVLDASALSESENRHIIAPDLARFSSVQNLAVEGYGAWPQTGIDFPSILRLGIWEFWGVVSNLNLAPFTALTELTVGCRGDAGAFKPTGAMLPSLRLLRILAPCRHTDPEEVDHYPVLLHVVPSITHLVIEENSFLTDEDAHNGWLCGTEFKDDADPEDRDFSSLLDALAKPSCCELLEHLTISAQILSQASIINLMTSRTGGEHGVNLDKSAPHQPALRLTLKDCEEYWEDDLLPFPNVNGVMWTELQTALSDMLVT